MSRTLVLLLAMKGSWKTRKFARFNHLVQTTRAVQGPNAMLPHKRTWKLQFWPRYCWVVGFTRYSFIPLQLFVKMLTALDVRLKQRNLPSTLMKRTRHSSLRKETRIHA